ncbi:hypothetical protein R69927_07215 [Paraburkholderia domus]|uniref:Uncharacterized protein n=1 Tax=Paraburkholderia domus TaxID=2793075 RepID=A0A9N8N979_9BURK|nr:hypothetical protein [Paraburkholderia domus]MBK5091062.1 hypothetical protein [Burkholderia sp. R-69927]MBK5169823.1 hypothetical protein [Burkholderia sp. R-70211]CAE6932103.1 hypothetical protein R69927_07215 [Paraburkholderia domus]CAE6966284.1 hypothetical protein R70211_07378 [Paraburkholderia domus]CAE6966685.1 hypothetical protein R75471_07077 [Paraburkholderia domus]
MRHIVIGLFDTYSQAEAARNTLVQTGFARETIELQANPEPSVGSATDEVANSGILANIERFLSSLFATGSRPPETTRYAEAVRRGAVLVCVSAASESHAELARNTLTRLGATDIGERSPDWDTQPESSRDHSILDELGIGAVMPGTPHTSSEATRGVATPGATTASSTTRPASTSDPLYPSPLMGTDAEPFVPPPAERPVFGPVDEPVVDPLVSEAERNAIAAGSMPGSGAIMRPSEVVSEAGQPTAGSGEQIPNEYLEYEEDFRAHYDEQYAAGNGRYEDYVPAYRYGAEIGQDARYRDRPWDDVEPEARRHWETTSPDSTWERFKLAVRHGWERVTGHHHV